MNADFFVQPNPCVLVKGFAPEVQSQSITTKPKIIPCDNAAKEQDAESWLQTMDWNLFPCRPDKKTGVTASLPGGGEDRHTFCL